MCFSNQILVQILALGSKCQIMKIQHVFDVWKCIGVECKGGIFTNALYTCGEIHFTLVGKYISHLWGNALTLVGKYISHLVGTNLRLTADHDSV